MKLLMLAIILSIVIVLSLGLFIRKQLSVTATMNRYINAYVEQGKFSGVVLVAKNGKVLLSKGYGMANYELDVPNMPQTTFRIGSVTKQFTAMPIIQLLDKLSLKNGLDTPVSEYVPDYPQGNKITLYHLLNHKSGIPNYTSFEEYPDKATRPVSLEKHIEFFKYKPLNFEPGEKYEYSNSNYVLLAYIIEKATGMPYEIYLQKFIFQPLNMSNSGCTDNKSLQKNKASGYSVSIEGIINAQYEDPSWLTGDGGIYATVEDLYKWDRALYTEKLASKETLNTIFKSLKADPIKDEYAYGWVLDSWNGHPLMWHNGRISGCLLYTSPSPRD